MVIELIKEIQFLCKTQKHLRALPLGLQPKAIRWFVNNRLSYYTGAREKAEGEIQQTEKGKKPTL
jgi:hypothetical protein